MGKPSAGAPGATSLEEASMAASGEAVTGDLEMAAGTLAPAVSRGLSAPISAPAPAPVAVASVSKKDMTNFGSFKVHFTPLGYTECYRTRQRAGSRPWAVRRQQGVRVGGVDTGIVGGGAAQ